MSEMPYLVVTTPSSRFVRVRARPCVCVRVCMRVRPYVRLSKLVLKLAADSSANLECLLSRSEGFPLLLTPHLELLQRRLGK